MAKNTRFPASSEPFDIFPDNLADNTAPMTSHAPMPSVVKPNRRPLTSSNSNIAFNANAFPTNPNYSPYNAKARPMSSHQQPLGSIQGNKLNLVPMAPPVSKAHSTDSLQKKPFVSNFKTGSQGRPMDASFVMGKENIHPQIYPAPTASFSIESYNFKPNANGKRGLMDAAPIKDSRPNKKMKVEPTSAPNPSSFPAIHDDGAKPPHSYAQLIGMAILRSPNKRLTLAQIYKWISDHYSFYNPTDAGWQNSIRHNLSLHKSFIKIERPKDDPGKGNYWGIQPGNEGQFLKEKPSRKAAPTAENLPVMSTQLEPSQPIQEPTLPPPLPVSQAPLPPLPTSQATMPLPVDLSSDATILISDCTEDGGERGGDNEVNLDLGYSPLPAGLHSSPPVSRHEQRSNTPPPIPPNMLSSIHRPHRRKTTSLDDSGYISSLESSVMRPNPKHMILTSEPDRPRSKTGRAEEEIARLRGSSPFNSPSKNRSFSALPPPPPSSSPLRHAHDNQMLPPLTPVWKMKPISRPPPSISPNTNLRNHRAKVSCMLQSPLRRIVGATEDPAPYSPAFKLDDFTFNNDCDGTAAGELNIWQDLEIYDENVFGSASATALGSPIKRSAKRVRMDRSVSTSALGDITNSAAKKTISSATLKAPGTPGVSFETPSKVFEDLESPSKIFSQSPIRNESPSKFANFFDDLDNAGWNFSMPTAGFQIPGLPGTTPSVSQEVMGVDILQGFGKIGDSSQLNKASKGGNSNAKPGLGRSYSTTF